MKIAPQPKRIRDLQALIGELCELHDDLAALIQKKIDSMKRSDLKGMQELGAEESAVVERIHEREGLRRQLTDAVAEEMGLGPRSGRDLSVTELASHLKAEQAERLVDSAAGLRERVERVARINQVAGVISREVVRHLNWILGAVGRGRDGVVGYAGSGAPLGAPDGRILDAVG